MLQAGKTDNENQDRESENIGLAIMAHEKHLSAAESAAEQKMRRKRRRIILSVIIFLMAAAVTAEVVVLKTMTSVDRRFIRGVERGVSDGWSSGDSDLQLKDRGKITDTSFIDTEYEAVSEFRNKAYQDKALKKLAKKYIDDLKKCRAAAAAFDPSSDSEKFWREFAEPYTDRLTILRKLYLGEYSMGDSWAGYPEALDEVLFRGWTAETAAVLKFEREPKDNVIDRFKATFTNDSGFDIEHISLEVELFDSKDNPAGTAEVYAEDIKNGSSIELSFYFNSKKVKSYSITGVDCKAVYNTEELGA